MKIKMKTIRKKFTWRLLLKNIGISILIIAGLDIWSGRSGLEDGHLIPVIAYISAIIAITMALTIAQTLTTNYFVGQFFGLVLVVVLIIFWSIIYIVCFKIFGINILEIYFDVNKMKFIIKPH
ncbi:hypothetical protein BBF96_08775 [Anoxybacter fermentans]|uniref:Uncharacterized protein n=1 Tax=Anoxybacter fermentans TaxID=1323375 RepID=A0A3S9SYN8_9FIRM|nr:hypothetical protein [Anoxybacter fermentans]AZR73466.1 hypothetical protein BBF96_08775 [Anoxybacter fermentans]